MSGRGEEEEVCKVHIRTQYRCRLVATAVRRVELAKRAWTAGNSLYLQRNKCPHFSAWFRGRCSAWNPASPLSDLVLKNIDARCHLTHAHSFSS